MELSYQSKAFEELVTSTNDCCIVNLQQGLDVFGFFKIFQKVPVLLHLIRPTTHKLTARLLLNLLSPEFSQEGSACYLREKQVYAFFVKYVRGFKWPKRWNHFASCSVICYGGFVGASPRICPSPLY